MSQLLIRQALENAVNGMSPALSTAWDNVSFTPATGTAYQRVSVLFGTPLNPSVGGNHTREVGFLQVSLFYPLQVGTSAAMTRAELVRTTFPRGETFTDGGQVVKISNTPEIVPGYRDGDRWRVTIKARFWADVIS